MENCAKIRADSNPCMICADRLEVTDESVLVFGEGGAARADAITRCRLATVDCEK